jgi:hypothetical protein
MTDPRSCTQSHFVNNVPPQPRLFFHSNTATHASLGSSALRVALPC